MRLDASEYKYQNAGQYRAIMGSLGYSEEYNNGHLKFTSSSGESTAISLNEIKSNAVSTESEKSYTQSLEYITSFFDKEQAKNNFSSYSNLLEKEYGVSLIKWDNLKNTQNRKPNQSKDGFTIIDHKHKISYTGSELYEYSYKKGVALDGQGTQIENDYSELEKMTGEDSRYYKNKKNNLVIQSRNNIKIPKKLYGNKLQDWQKESLANGELVIIRNKKNKPIYLQIDRSNNTLIVRTNKEINFKMRSIGGHKLTDLELACLLNNKFTPPIVIKDGDSFFLTQIRRSEDKKGIEYTNMKQISKEDALEYNIKSNTMNITETQDIFLKNGEKVVPDIAFDLELELMKNLSTDIKGAEKVAIELSKDGISTNLKNFYDKHNYTDKLQELDKAKGFLGIKENSPQYQDLLNNFQKEIKADIESIQAMPLENDENTRQAKETLQEKIQTKDLTIEIDALKVLQQEPENGLEKFNLSIASQDVTIEKEALLNKYDLVKEYESFTLAHNELKKHGSSISLAETFLDKKEELTNKIDKIVFSLENKLTINPQVAVKSEIDLADQQYINAVQTGDNTSINKMIADGYEPSNRANDIIQQDKELLESVMKSDNVVNALTSHFKDEQKLDDFLSKFNLHKEFDQAFHSNLEADRTHFRAKWMPDLEGEVYPFTHEQEKTELSKLEGIAEKNDEAFKNTIASKLDQIEKNKIVILKPDDKLALDAIKKEDYTTLNKMVEQGYKPSEALKNEINKLDITDHKKAGINSLLGLDKDKAKQTSIKKDQDKSSVKSNIKDQTLKAADGLFR